MSAELSLRYSQMINLPVAIEAAHVLNSCSETHHMQDMSRVNVKEPSMPNHQDHIT